MMKKCWGIIQLSVLILWLGIPVAAQQVSSGEVGELKKEIETLKEGQKAIQKELQEIKSLLRPKQVQAPTPTAPAEFVLDVGEHPFKGDRSSQLTLVEFTDYQ
jgi:protein-disulfide isomerase